jgi:curved DNA-binding protein
VEVTLEESYHGTRRLLQIGDRRIEANIPPGVRTGSRIRLAGQGEPGRNGGQPGDLYLITRVLPNPAFEREGDDLLTQVSVDIYTAVLGGEVRVQTLDRPLMLRIPAKTQADRSFRLRGKGMPHLGNPGQHGDLYARVKLTLPEPLSDREIELFREAASTKQKA